MRVLHVRFKNLNSLAGEWQIDLTHPAFVSDGIFAITGPTGAGKTTILDAICLALYGRTPRLNKVTKSGNEIMSRQTGECFAEVTFETGTGRFRCHWSQRRAHNKSGGNLQAPKHEIANAVSDEIIESKITTVASQIESATGMDFDRFTRSMLLAQGDFAAFLQAAPNDRAPILEQITGTEIYSEISIRVHERQYEEQEKLKLLQAEIAGIEILDAEQEEQVELELNARKYEEKELSGKIADFRKAIDWLTKIDVLKQEIEDLVDQEDRLNIEVEAFRPNLDKLNLSLRAASLDGAYATLVGIRKHNADDIAALKTREKTLPNLERAAAVLAQAMKDAEERTVLAKEELKTAGPVLKKVRLLDQTINDLKKAVSESEKICETESAKIAANNNTRLAQQDKHSSAYESLKLVDNYLKEHVQDEWLIGGLAGVEEQIKSLCSKRKQFLEKDTYIFQAQLALKAAAQSLKDRQKQTEIRKQELNETSQRLKHGEDTLTQILAGRSFREYRTELEMLMREMALQTKIRELEDHRAQLEDGKPCPLCGATEHPFAKGNIPIQDETQIKIDSLTQLIRKAEHQEESIKSIQKAETLAHNNWTEAKELESQAANDKEIKKISLTSAEEELKTIQYELDELEQTVSAALSPLGIVITPSTDITPLVETLRSRRKRWQEKVKLRQDCEKQIADIDSELKKLDAVIDTQNTALADKLESLQTLKNDLAAANQKRIALYGDKNPDDEEHRLNKKVSEAEQIEEQATERHNELQQEFTTVKTHIESLKNNIDQRKPELENQETAFIAALERVGFFDEKQFLAAKLPPEQQSELTDASNKLNERQTALKITKKDRKEQMAAELAKKVTEESLEVLQPQLQQHDQSLGELTDTIAGLKHKLRQNALAKEQIKERQSAIDAQKKECGRWGRLHQLIGSADGKKYRNFAQGLTFEIVISHANQQLQKMSDRYLLIRDDAQPLELNVIDNYQAGEIRTTKNLSGGESFIISLSLALGLSNMVSKNVQVDSLFLDEGFGTLDEEALDIALETLSGLQHDGKLIGVISHVSALKERISTQIQVAFQTGGRSQISGPGCGR